MTPQAKTKILIAEDDPDSNRLLDRILTNKGYQVIKTVNGQEALNVLNSESPPHLALLDWNMPEMNGLEVVEQLRSGTISKDYIYTILVTARTDKNDILQGLKVGADDYIRKPFDRKELLARIRAGERLVKLERELVQKNIALKKANERMKNDLLIAADFQKSLLPSSMPAQDKIKIEWIYEPCDELAGDLINVFEIDEKNIGLFLLDVSGHGVAAAFLTATLNRVLAPKPGNSKASSNGNNIESFLSPVEIANNLNQQFCLSETQRQYFTIIYGVLNLDSLTFRFVSAGHPRPIYLNQQQASAIKIKGLPIGFSETPEYTEHIIKLKTGDRLFFYSDGIKEVANSEDEFLGESGIKTAIEKNAHLSLKENIEEILTIAKAYCADSIEDDVTLLALEVL